MKIEISEQELASIMAASFCLRKSRENGKCFCQTPSCAYYKDNKCTKVNMEIKGTFICDDFKVKRSDANEDEVCNNN